MIGHYPLMPDRMKVDRDVEELRKEKEKILLNIAEEKNKPLILIHDPFHEEHKFLQNYYQLYIHLLPH